MTQLFTSAFDFWNAGTPAGRRSAASSFGTGALGIAGGILDARESQRSLRSQRRGLLQQNQLSQQIFRQNAQFSLAVGDFNAQAAMNQAEAEALRVRRDRRQRIGATAARFGASGVDVNVGSPLEVLADMASRAEEDIQTVRYQGRVQAQRERFSAAVAAHRENVRSITTQFTTDLRINALNEQSNAINRRLGATLLFGGF